MNEYTSLAERLGNYSRSAIYAAAIAAYTLTAMPSTAYAAESGWKEKQAKVSEKAKEVKGKAKEGLANAGKKLRNVTADQAEVTGEQVGGVIISIPLGFVHGVKKAVTKTEDYQKGVDIINRYLTKEGRDAAALENIEGKLYEGQKDTADLTARLSQFDTTIQYEDPTRQRLREVIYAKVARELKREIYDQTEKGMKELSEGIDRKELKEISDLAYQQAEPIFKPLTYAEIDKKLAKMQEDTVRDMHKRASGNATYRAPKAASSEKAPASGKKTEKPAKKKALSWD